MKLFSTYLFSLLFILAVFEPTIHLIVKQTADIYTIDKNLESTDSDSESTKNNVEDDSELEDYFLNPTTLLIIPSLKYKTKGANRFYLGTIRTIKSPPPKI